MNTTFEKYLDTIDKCLKPLPTSERVDIVKEIKGSILEMESENLSTEQILTRLGKQKDLAKAYLGDLLAKENGFSWNRFLTVCAFYSLVGFSGLFVIPVLVIVAPTFILCGVLLRGADRVVPVGHAGGRHGGAGKFGGVFAVERRYEAEKSVLRAFFSAFRPILRVLFAEKPLRFVCLYGMLCVYVRLRY